jgi:hypothetical protein
MMEVPVWCKLYQPVGTASCMLIINIKMAKIKQRLLEGKYLEVTGGERLSEL